jgi:cell division protein FtsB
MDESQDSRQLRKKESLLTVVARFIKYNKYFTLFIIILVTLVYMTVFGNKGLLHRLEMESEKSSLEEELKKENIRTKSLQQEIDELNNSDDKIEKVAREKYGLTKEGEKIYKVTVDSTK